MYISFFTQHRNTCHPTRDRRRRCGSSIETLFLAAIHCRESTTVPIITLSYIQNSELDIILSTNSIIMNNSIYSINNYLNELRLSLVTQIVHQPHHKRPGRDARFKDQKPLSLFVIATARNETLTGRQRLAIREMPRIDAFRRDV